MTRQKDGTIRATYSVRLNPDLLRLLKHIAVDEKTSIGELLEEGIRAVIKKRKAVTGYTIHYKGIKLKDDSVDMDSDKYEIPKFLRKQPDE
jgi:hypothetical protein